MLIRRYYRAVVIVLSCTALVALIAYFVIRDLFYSNNIPNFSEVNSTWQIPDSARDVNFENGTGGNRYLKLSFKVPQSDIGKFTNSICDGILHKGYNPYNAVNVTHSVPHARLYLMKNDAHLFTYYSYSADTPDTVSGMRCQPWDSSPYQMRVTQLNDDLAEVRLDVGHFLSGENCVNIPCKFIGNNYVRPIAEFPLVIMGLEEMSPNSKVYRLVTDELCLSFQLDYREEQFYGWNGNSAWRYLESAKFRLRIDDQQYRDAVVTKYHQLAFEDEPQNAPGFHYCVSQNWAAGTHRMSFMVMTAANTQKEYQWEFQVM
jgi:hypothetical protein